MRQKLDVYEKVYPSTSMCLTGLLSQRVHLLHHSYSTQCYITTSWLSIWPVLLVQKSFLTCHAQSEQKCLVMIPTMWLQTKGSLVDFCQGQFSFSMFFTFFYFIISLCNVHCSPSGTLVCFDASGWCSGRRVACSLISLKCSDLTWFETYCFWQMIRLCGLNDWRRFGSWRSS